ncbi:MAG: hypothetical protein EBQ89_10900 [Alphaproteobacteria bacterium]|nr:hypothetical protein [Alphaproteobacteria bacterium]
MKNKYYDDLSIDVKNKKTSDTKNLIVLCHTHRNLNDYLSSIKYRYNGYYDKIPNYVIGLDGGIYKILDKYDYTNFLDDETLNKRSIIVILENLGWLNKEPLSNSYINWIGDIYNGIVFDRKWRDYFFWHKYTNEQIISAGILCNKLLKDCNIKKNIIGHNTKINGIEKIEGVISRSNIFSECTDLNPSFDFDFMLKTMEDEQLS